MPVYNESRFLAKAIDSLLAQDEGDFELLVCDNASTDDTVGIAERYAARDPRVRVVRSDRNIGAAANFNRPVMLARGRYFAWTAGHDLWEPSFVRRTVSVLEARPEIVMVYARTRWIDVDDQVIGDVPDGIGTETLGRLARYHVVLWRAMWGTAIHGMFRLSALRRTGLVRSVPSCDKLLLAEVALQGGFVEVPEPLFRWRRLRPGETAAEARRRGTKMVLQPGDVAIFPHLRKAREYARMIAGADVSLAEKAAFMLSTAISLSARDGGRWRAELRAGATRGAEQLTERFRRRRAGVHDRGR